jgi:hypothetical protein
VLYDRWSGYRSSPGEAVKNHAETKVMIAVPVSHVDRGEVLSGGGYPTCEGSCLGRGHQRVDEHRVALTSDERRRDRRPRLVLDAWRQVGEPRQGRPSVAPLNES